MPVDAVPAPAAEAAPAEPPRAEPGRPPGDSAIQPPPTAFDGPASRAAPPPAALLAPPPPARAGGVWAVVIGIDDYPGSRSDLRSAVRDADDVDLALERYGVPADRRLVLRNGQASGGNIRAAADWLVARAGPDATAVFFYAGHVRALSSATQAIVGADGGLVRDTDLAAHLRGLEARETWVGMAACYGGGFTEVLGPGRVLTAAAAAGDLAYENERFGRSYMVEYMVRRAMIQGSSGHSVQAAFRWAKAALDRDYPNRSPVIVDDSDGEVTLGRAPAAPSAPRDPGGGQPGGGKGGGDAPPPDNGCRQLTLGLVTCN